MTQRGLGILAASGALLGAVALSSGPALAQCEGLPTYADLKLAAQDAVVALQADGVGFGNEAWATVVNRAGDVCQVAFTGQAAGDQWLGSRVISAQKANTANGYSLEGTYTGTAVAGVGRALSSGNLYGLVLEQGSLFGLQFSNPVNVPNAYSGNASAYGTANDPLKGKKVGGVNVFGGGLALYDDTGALIGGLGLSGDTSCADHINAWRVRHALLLDFIPGGVAPAPGGAAPDFTDNLILEAEVTPNTFQHPLCGFGEEGIIETLPTDVPVSVVGGPPPAETTTPPAETTP